MMIISYDVNTENKKACATIPCWAGFVLRLLIEIYSFLTFI